MESKKDLTKVLKLNSKSDFKKYLLNKWLELLESEKEEIRFNALREMSKLTFSVNSAIGLGDVLSSSPYTFLEEQQYSGITEPAEGFIMAYSQQFNNLLTDTGKALIISRFNLPAFILYSGDSMNKIQVKKIPKIPKYSLPAIVY